MGARIRIVEIYPDGKFEIVPNEIQKPRRLSHAEQIRSDILSDDSPIANRERCMHLAENVRTLQGHVVVTLKSLLNASPAIPFYKICRGLNRRLHCKFPPIAVHRVLERVCPRRKIEYTSGKGVIRATTANTLAKRVRASLRKHWCIERNDFLGQLGLDPRRIDSTTIETINAALGRRGIFSIGHCPVIAGEMWEKFLEVEGLFAQEQTGIEDVGLWGGTGTGVEQVYAYTGMDLMDFRFRLYFTGKSAADLFALVRAYLHHVQRASAIWIAKRFGRSLAERELILFLLLSQGISFQESGSAKEIRRADLASRRDDFGLLLEDSLMFTLRELDEHATKVAASLADAIEREVRSNEVEQ